MHHNHYYVYTHTRLDTEEIFYVGIGKREKRYNKSTGKTKYARAYAKSKRSNFWKQITAKTDFKVNIVFETTSEADVKFKEQELITYYGRRCCDDKGSLVNFTSGGDRTDGPRNFGIRITQRDLKTKEIIKIWDELKHIEQQLGYLKTNIVKCCRKKQLSAYGFYWEYTDDRSYDNKKSSTARKKTTNRKVGILVYDQNNKPICSFTTQQETADYFNIHRTTLHKYLHGKQKHKFLIFKYDTWIK
jgi:hypothetical protein